MNGIATILHAPQRNSCPHGAIHESFFNSRNRKVAIHCVFPQTETRINKNSAVRNSCGKADFKRLFGAEFARKEKPNENPIGKPNRNLNVDVDVDVDVDADADADADGDGDMDAVGISKIPLRVLKNDKSHRTVKGFLDGEGRALPIPFPL